VYYEVHWIEMAKNAVQLRTLVHMVMSLRIPWQSEGTKKRKAYIATWKNLLQSDIVSCLQPMSMN